MAQLGKRNPFETDFTLGFDSYGKLVALKLDYYMDSGCSINDTIGNMQMAMTTCDGAYYCPNWLVTPFFVCTNTPSNTWARAPGCCPAIFVIETIMDHIAQYLQVVPSVVRYANLYQQGQVTPYLQPLPYCSLSKLWMKFIETTNYNTRLAAVASFNEANRWRKRGMSLAPNK